MKIKLLLILFFHQLCFSQVGIETTAPNAQLDVTANDKGILIPRVGLTSLSTASPIVNPQGGLLATSTLVYHTGVNSINAGYYYWDGTRWLGLVNDSVYSSTNKGLQYYVFTSSGSVPPNIDKSNFVMTNFSSGLWSGLLDDATRNILRGTNTDNYSILFEGKLIV